MSSRNPYRRILPATALLLVLAGGATFQAFRSDATDQPDYVTATVGRRDIVQSVLANGTLKAQAQVSVGAQVSGQIKSLKVAPGDRVEKGEVIAEIDSMTQRNELRQAEAHLKDVTAQRESKRASLRQAQLAFARRELLLRQDAGSKEDYESAEATLKATQADIAALDAQIQQATVSVDIAKVNLGYTTITAPMDGVVIHVAVREGQTVNAVQSTPTIVKLAQLETMTVEAQISEADVVRVAPGMPVTFTILGAPDHPYAAKLRAIRLAPESVAKEDESTAISSSAGSSNASSSAVYYNGLFDAANPDGRLRIAMTAQVSIVLAKAQGVLAIPLTALGVSDGSRAMVQILDAKGISQPREIETGISDAANIEVRRGLQEGEQVILGSAPVQAGAAQGDPLLGF
ncbi:efflux RND transporter periplasmic adaptor subunit [Dongia sp.]|uniref:efflux RND transporter periplasmic adaptor subunit n=1 Tax=Dongia sp. TaxID=1977262 RepID=UPI0035AEE742